MGFSLLRLVAKCTVRSYRTFSPLPVLPKQPSAVLLSVPLSVALPRPAVSRHSALRSPDFPPRMPYAMRGDCLACLYARRIIARYGVGRLNTDGSNGLTVARYSGLNLNQDKAGSRRQYTSYGKASQRCTGSNLIHYIGWRCNLPLLLMVGFGGMSKGCLKAISFQTAFYYTANINPLCRPAVRRHRHRAASVCHPQWRRKESCLQKRRIWPFCAGRSWPRQSPCGR